MKITQTLIKQEVLTPLAYLPWNKGVGSEEGREVLPLPGVMILKKTDGTITIYPHNTTLPAGFDSYTITISNMTVHESAIIQMNQFSLEPSHSYLLTMQGFKLKPNGKGYELETHVLEFTPEN